MFAAVLAVVGAMFVSAVPDCGKGSDGKLFPNPDDCSTFYQCRNGGAILQECPEDLVYNKDLETCSWSWDAPPCDEGVSGGGTGGGSNSRTCGWGVIIDDYEFEGEG